MILILGKGHLASAINTRLVGRDAVMVGRPEFDFEQQRDCDKLIAQYPNPDVIINTIGAVSTDHWRNLTVNFVAPTYITLQYIQQTKNCHVINISSCSAWWVSYPNIPLDRFSYNVAKESLSTFGRHINRSIVDQENGIVITTIEPGKFDSAMSGNTGLPVDRIVDLVEIAIQTRVQNLSLMK